MDATLGFTSPRLMALKIKEERDRRDCREHVARTEDIRKEYEF